VTTAPSSDTDASWSPDGQCIVYSTDHGGLPVPNLFIIPASGGEPVRVTFSETHEDGAPSWSPASASSAWIAFESHEGQDEDSPAALWRIAVPAGGCQGPGFHAYLPLTLTVSPPPLPAVNDFLYQLQNLDLQAIGDTAYDLVVMDYSAEGDDGTAFTAAQIAALKHSAGGDKVVLAYMSIGEAETYRFYWQDGWQPGNPPWLDGENPDWPGNYKVHYWDPAWQAIIFSYADRLLAAGFDGAYLDIIDGYEYYAEQGRLTAAQEMVDFVAAIRAYTRARAPDFLIFPQNAPELAALLPGYLDHVDGIGQEDIYYGYEDDDVITPPEVTAELEGYLDIFTAAGKLVLTVDYAITPAHVDDAYAKSHARGYVPFCTVRDLDRLTINPGHEPD
jgi:cysteinyl-tRNA synthetase